MAAALAAAWIYFPALHSYLVTDDFQWLEGAMVLTPARLFDVASRSHFYRPAIEAHFALLYQAFGCSAVAAHASNILLHAVNAGLVIVLAQALTADVAIAAIAGLLFATQPALAQAVLWPAAISSVLCATCGLAMLIADTHRWRVGRVPRSEVGRVPRSGPGGVEDVGRVPRSGPGGVEDVGRVSRSGPGGAHDGGRVPRSGPGGVEDVGRVPRSGPGGAHDGGRVPRSGPGAWSFAVVLAYGLALAAHESGVVFLAAAVLLRIARGDAFEWRRWLRDYLPCAVLLAGYMALTAWINSRNYVVTEGHYRLGAHIVTNLLDYLVALYEGRHRALDYTLVALVLLTTLIAAPRRVRMWTLWLLAALMPVLAFTNPPASRYLYIPSIPFSLLVAAGIVAAARHIAMLSPLHRHRRRTIAAVVIVATGFLIVRSALFARKGVAGFDAEAAPFARVAGDLRPVGTQPDGGTSFVIPASAVGWMDPQYLTPLARVAACDPRATVRVD